MLKSLLWLHIGAGIAAILLGTVAVAARKGGRVHLSTGAWFAVAMIVLGLTASILEPFRKPQPGSPLVGLFVCYFVATSWVTARRRDGRTGKFEIAAAAVALGTGALMLWAGLTGQSATPVGSGPVFIAAGLCLIAGFLDLRVVLRKTLTAGERLRRHVWRMCVAFFIATGSFFIGQQDILPAVVRGSPVLFFLGFAPIGVMGFWLVRLRFAKVLNRLLRRLPAPPSTALES